MSGSFGKTFDRGHVNISADYYRQEKLAAGDREFFTCRNQYVFDPATGARADRIDPRTGNPTCNNVAWGQVYTYTAGGSPLAGRFQYDYDRDLGSYIPNRPANPATAARYPNAPAGFYLVNYDVATRAVTNNRHPEFVDQNSIIPEMDRYTVFSEGQYDLGDGVELYGELLLNRRESRADSYRQFWNYVFTSNFFDLDGDPTTSGGDPVNDFTGFNLMSPTPVTDHYGTSQRVDYTRYVVGLRGSGGGWNWDVFAQHSRSDGEYTTDVILNDAVDSTSFKTESCVGTNLPISGRPCIDVDFTRPGLLAGDFTQAERDFLFDTEVGTTTYEQSYIEASIAGHLIDLPAGSLGAAFGVHLRRDEIVDTPGEVTLADNSWGLTGAGITRGKEETKEVYAEFAVPLLADLPYVQKLDLSLSGRHTETDTSGGATTYKVGLNWAVSDAIRVRATHGTSFRAPALFELYLADQTSYSGQRNVDPCLNLDQRIADGSLSATSPLNVNCRAASGPGGGVPGDFVGGVSNVEVITGGGLGVLKPETSQATVVGLVLTPPDSNLSIAIDYFDITIEDQVSVLGGGGILQACYLSENFPNDPICDQFDRNPVNKGIDVVRDSFLNIAEQNNRGLDITTRLFHDFDWATATLDTQTTWTLESNQSTFADFGTDFLGDVGYPELVGNINLTVERGPWSAFWGFDWTGNQDNRPDIIRTGGTLINPIDGRSTVMKADVEFVGFHSVSLSYEMEEGGWTGGWSISGGVANLFNETPPILSFNAGAASAGNALFQSQYSEAYYGRRAFVRISKTF